MASLLADITSIKTACDNDFKGIEGFDDDVLLMSLLEESQGDHESNDERLKSVIRSLEAEINPNIILDGYDLAMNTAEMPSDGEDTNELFNMAEMESLSLDFEMVDMEMGVPSSPSDHEMNFWYMEPSENEMVEFGVNYFQFGLEAPSEEHIEYSSLWQETYDTIMYS